MNWAIRQKVDLNVGFKQNVRINTALMIPSNQSAHTIEVEVYKGTQEVSLTGYVARGYFVRSDGNAVVVNGSINGNTVEVTMAQACYAYQGILRCVVAVTKANENITLCQLFCTVRKSIPSQVVDPGSIVPDVDTLISQIQRINNFPDVYADSNGDIVVDYGT